MTNSTDSITTAASPAVAGSPLAFTVKNLRPATAVEAARFAFVPLSATDLGLPPTFGDLELWVGEHQKLTLPLVVPVELSSKVASNSATVVLVSGRPLPLEVEVERGSESWPFFACWVLVDAIAPATTERVWQNFPATIAGRPRQGLVPVRLAGMPGAVPVRFTATPPPPRTESKLYVKLTLNRLIRSGMQLASVGFFGYAGDANSASRSSVAAPAKPAAAIAPAAAPADQPDPATDDKLKKTQALWDELAAADDADTSAPDH